MYHFALPLCSTRQSRFEQLRMGLFKLTVNQVPALTQTVHKIALYHYTYINVHSCVSLPYACHDTLCVLRWLDLSVRNVWILVTELLYTLRTELVFSEGSIKQQVVYTDHSASVLPPHS